MNIPVNLVFEDAISEFTMVKILDSFEGKFETATSYPGNGSGYIKNNINGFNEASKSTPFFVLTDLDNYNCPIALKNDWLSRPEKPNLIFRIAIREVESWLLSDIVGFAEFIGISEVNFPLNPEVETNPKQTLINLVKRSRKRLIKEDIIPLNDNAKIGPNYNERLMQFVADFWNIERAKTRSQSLRRTYDKLFNFEYILPQN